LYDLIREEMYGAKTVVIGVKDKHIVEVELEYVFRYGIFGYGYSHILKHKNHDVSHVLSESMFFRGKS